MDAKRRMTLDRLYPQGDDAGAVGVELAEAVASRRQGWTDVGPVP